MGFMLTPQQKYIHDEALKFLKNNSEQLFQIDGLAGTGKSVLLNSILQDSGIPKHRIAPLSYIGQACIVMRRKGMMNAKTIHSWLFESVDEYVYDKDGNIVMDKYFDRPKIKSSWKPKPLIDIDLILIDEASAVPYEFRQEILSRGTTVIAVGDLGQLPPVYGNPAFLCDGKIYHLTEVLRQAAGSAILYIAHRARHGLPIHQGLYGNVLVIDECDLNDNMLSSADIVICGKNSTRDYINKRIRHDIYKIDQELPLYGEKMVCRKNNWNIEVDGINLANGLIGRVVNAPGVEGFDGKTFTMDFKPDFMRNAFLDVKCDYAYLTASAKQRNFLKNDRYNISEKFEYANAITCHMSQGAQFRNGIYIEEYLNKDIQNNLNYTGPTRFTDNLIYVKKQKKNFYFY